MKTPFDPRHQKRRETIQALFTWSFQGKKLDDELASQVINDLPKLDQLIGQAAPQWPLEQINRIDLAILRLAVYELVVAAKEPVKVVIDEAIELAKEFGSESSPSFINGVLGNIVNKKEEK